MKKVISSIVCLSLCSNALAVGYLDYLHPKVESTEVRIQMGAMIKKTEEFSDKFIPPVIDDLIMFGFKKYYSAVYDGMGDELGNNIVKLSKDELNKVDFSIYQNSKIPIDQFTAASHEIERKIESLRDKLKGIAPESQHTIIDAAIGSMLQKLTNHQIGYLANRVIKNESERKETESFLLKLYRDKVELTNKFSIFDQRIKNTEERLEQLSQKEELTQEEESERAALKKSLALERQIKKEQFKESLAHVNNIGSGIAAIISLENPAMAQQFLVANTSILKIIDSINELKEGAEGLSAFGHYGLIASASISLFQSWGILGGRSKDGIGGALRSISKQIERLQQRMDERFDRIENQLFLNHKEIIKNFALIHQNLATMQGTVEDSYRRILEVERRIRQNQISEGLTEATFYLEDHLTPLDRQCLNGPLKKKAIKRCLQDYNSFLNEKSISARLTQVGLRGEYHSHIDYQINMYQELFGHQKSISNPAIVKEIEMRLELLKKDYGKKVVNTKEYSQIKANLKDIRKAISEIVPTGEIAKNVDSISKNLRELRLYVKGVADQEFKKNILKPYLEELVSLKEEYAKAISERNNEIQSIHRKTRQSGEFYKNDLRLTINSLTKNIQKIDSFLTAIRLHDADNILTSQELDFPIIVHSNNKSGRPFLMSTNQIRALVPGLKMSNFQIARLLKLKYEFGTHNSKLDDSIYFQQNYHDSIVGGYRPFHNDGGDADSYDDSDEYTFYGFYEYIRLKGMLLAGDKTIEVLTLTDRNENCSKLNHSDRKLRKGAFFKNAMDPYSILKIKDDNMYPIPFSGKKCGALFEKTPNTSIANLQKEEANLNKSMENDNVGLRINNFQTMRTQLHNEKFVLSLEHLQNSINKTKGMIYFSNIESLDDAKLVTNFSKINTANIFDQALGQTEVISITGRGNLFEDIENALKEFINTPEP